MKKQVFLRKASQFYKSIVNDALLDTMRLLCLLPSFQEQVLKLRGSIGIPLEGVPFDDTAESQKSVAQLSREIVRTSDEHIFKLGLEVKKAPLNLLHTGIKEIVRSYKLPASFARSVEYYVKHNTVSAPRSSFQIISIPDRHGRMETYIKITGLMTTTEKKVAYEEAEELFLFQNPSVKAKRKRHRNIERDIKMFLDRGSSNGSKSLQAIVADFWTYDDQEDIPDEKTDKRHANTVSQAVSRLKKEIRTRFPGEGL
jgi:hypothetical protein